MTNEQIKHELYRLQDRVAELEKEIQKLKDEKEDKSHKCFVKGCDGGPVCKKDKEDSVDFCSCPSCKELL